MTPEDSAPAAAEPPKSAESPGALIRRTRERAGLSLEDLAGQIKLTKSTLDALERDDFPQLGQPVYVRGYYRKCAKVLPLSESDLIGAYEARVKPVAPVAPQRIPLAGGVSSGAAQGQPRQTLIIVVALGVLIGGLYWFAGDDGGLRPAAMSQTQVTEVPIPAAPEVAPAEPPAAVEAPGAETPVAETPAATAAETVEPVAPPNQLTLLFLEASWVRIEDSRNKTLLIGLVRAGEKQALNGEPPYTAFIGNARKVRAEFKGQPFDFTRHIQANDTARFTVP